MTTQIRFFDIENNAVHGGIMLDNGDVICGCCGGLFKSSEQNKTWKLLEKYNWLNLDEAICGDDLCDAVDDNL